eukprot:363897-Chlamydomonas_euryale.AAC.2
MLMQAERLRQQLRNSQLHQFREQSTLRRKVLRALEHIDEDDVVLIKGRAACEISAADELVTTGAFCCLSKRASKRFSPPPPPPATHLQQQNTLANAADTHTI